MTIAIEGIKASLATLELAILSNNGDNSLSSDEVESAHVSLDKLLMLAEDAKAKLPSTSAISTEQEEIDSIDIAASSSHPSDTTSHSSASASTLATEKQTSILKKKPPEEPSNDASSSNDNDYSDSAPPERRGLGQRRLSHPGFVPADAVAGQLEVSCYV